MTEPEREALIEAMARAMFDQQLASDQGLVFTDMARVALAALEAAGWRGPEAFGPTHQHKDGGLYKLTAVGRLEVTGDEAYPLAEYENAQGMKYAQCAERFHEPGRFVPLAAPEAPHD